jgi:hypothetical protein
LTLQVLHALNLASLAPGSIVQHGDTIGYTDRIGIPESRSSIVTTVSVLERDEYHPDQELMLIGSDGQPNIMYR